MLKMSFQKWWLFRKTIFRFHNASRNLTVDVLRERFLRGQRFVNPDKNQETIFRIWTCMEFWEAHIAFFLDASDLEVKKWCPAFQLHCTKVVRSRDWVSPREVSWSFVKFRELFLPPTRTSEPTSTRLCSVRRSLAKHNSLKYYTILYYTILYYTIL